MAVQQEIQRIQIGECDNEHEHEFENGSNGSESDDNINRIPVYVYTHRNKFMCLGAKSIDDFVDTYKYMIELMEMWKADGIQLLDNGCVEDDYATFYTYDAVIAEKHGFELEEIYE